MLDRLKIHRQPSLIYKDFDLPKTSAVNVFGGFMLSVVHEVSKVVDVTVNLGLIN